MVASGGDPTIQYARLAIPQLPRPTGASPRLSRLPQRTSQRGRRGVQLSCRHTIVQEAYGTHAEIREACDASISGQAATLEADIAEAMRLYRIRANWSAQSLALYTQAVLQGSFILAKAKGGPDVAVASIDHLRRYIQLLFMTRKRRHKSSDVRNTKEK